MVAPPPLRAAPVPPLAAAGGEAFKAEDTDGLQEIFGQIDSMETTEREAKVRVDPSDFFQWFHFAMICLAVVRVVIGETLLRRYP